MYIYGKNTILELLKSDTDVIEIFHTKEFKSSEILELIKKRRINVKIKEKNYIDKLAGTFAQGIVANINDYQYMSIEKLLNKIKNKKNALVLILDQITDVHNFASILRVCECVGVDGVIIPKNNSVSINAGVYKISSGAIFNVDVCMVTNISNCLRKLKDDGFWIVGSDLSTNTSYVDVDYDFNVGLVIGNEENGIRESTRKQCDYLVKIPMVGSVNSLNASVATGVLCYQIYNSRKEL